MWGPDPTKQVKSTLSYNPGFNRGFKTNANANTNWTGITIRTNSEEQGPSRPIYPWFMATHTINLFLPSRSEAPNCVGLIFSPKAKAAKQQPYTGEQSQRLGMNTKYSCVQPAIIGLYDVRHEHETCHATVLKLPTTNSTAPSQQPNPILKENVGRCEKRKCVAPTHPTWAKMATDHIYKYVSLLSIDYKYI